MPWVRFDDNTPEDPRVDHLSDGAFRLWFAAICFANRNLTDGYVPTARITRLTPAYSKRHLEQLVHAGMFHKEADGITINGYLRYQLSAEDIHAQRERERQKKARQRAGGYRHTGRDDTTGRFMSPGDTPRDNTGDSPGESGGESPATHPTPPPYRESSSSEPRVRAALEDEEDPYRTEARRRLNATPSTVINTEAWIDTTAQRLRQDGWQPAPQRPTAPPPRCPTCKDLPLDEPCPDCNPRSATA